MRVFITDRGTRFPPPPEQLPALADQFAGWRDRWRDKMESFEFFSDNNGGFGVVNVADETELYQLMSEYPFGPFDDVEARPIVDGDTALPRFREAVESMVS